MKIDVAVHDAHRTTFAEVFVVTCSCGWVSPAAGTNWMLFRYERRHLRNEQRAYEARNT